MRKLIILALIFLVSCSREKKEIRGTISLEGTWKFRIDSADTGIKEKWYSLIEGEDIKLPGSMADNGKGYEVTVNTSWTGDIVDRSYFTDPQYERYRQPGNIKIPFWLKPVKYYTGAAWYQKEFELPEDWAGKKITLFLERPHWETTVYVNGTLAGTGNSLAVPHQYDVSGFLREGKNIISIRVDNRMVIPVGINSHSVSDHTQGNWNGITGEITLNATAPVYISDINIYPDIRNKLAEVIIRISNTTGSALKGRLDLVAEGMNLQHNNSLEAIQKDVEIVPGDSEFAISYPMSEDFTGWDEFQPALYKLNADLHDNDDNLIDRTHETFGMREFKTEGTLFTINGRRVFLRGTTECCIFPLTGYPPADTASWMKVLGTIKDYGLNHVRFHSYCPPEAAFDAADILGIYFHVECSSWANQGTAIGNGEAIDTFIYNEGDRIIREYGNHPSFCMLAYGNEPAGSQQDAFLGSLINYWKEKDSRRVYTSAAGWPLIPESDYHLTPGPRLQQWGDGLKSIINAQTPGTMFDYRNFISRYDVPVVGHETGQWCVFPDFSEIEKYTGTLKATNFEIFRETLDENRMGHQAKDFLMASGKLQAICYKSEIEAALRTPGFAGFQMLQIHDFPGQGTALVGILNPFFESKGYITPAEFRMFCSQTVPLARIPKLILRDDEPFTADIEIAHFGPEPIENAIVRCRISDTSGEILYDKSFEPVEVSIGNNIQAGSVRYDPAQGKTARKLILEAAIEGTSYMNRWEFWYYPEAPELNEGRVHMTTRLDGRAEAVLKNGGTVLLLPYGRIGKEMGAEVAVGFSSIFWNTAWTNNQAPHTLGILCDPDNPFFREFPTEFHSNWQWHDPVMHSQAMIINDLPGELKPLIQLIDTWFENRKLALAFEAKVAGGKLVVCSIDFKNIDKERIASKQLLSSIMSYMNSNDFDPRIELSLSQLRELTGD